jgi:fructoselysine-6-P-deglycase FrlB-like protein
LLYPAPEMNQTAQEIASQPDCWRQAVDRVTEALPVLPQRGERVAIVGCGTSWFIGQAYAAAREEAGHGPTDAFAASEALTERHYDRWIALSRSGTTSEVVRLVQDLPAGTASVAISAVPGTPIPDASQHRVFLDFADESSVVQTRFATTALALLRAHLGEDLTGAIADAERAVADPLPVDVTAFDHLVFLGHGASVGLANEAALKMREAAQAHTESYPAMEYRHGPISLAGPTSLVWILGTGDGAVAADVRRTGASVIEPHLDPMAELIMIQRGAVALAESRGLDPDRPRNLTRSVVLP